VHSVPDHCYLARQCELGKRKPQQFPLVGSRAIQFGTEHSAKVPIHLKVLDYPIRKHERLARRNVQFSAGGNELLKHIDDSRVRYILFPSVLREPFSVMPHGFGSKRAPNQRAEALEEWWTDTPGEIVIARALQSKTIHGVANRSNDSRLWVGECTVEIEENCIVHR
jgi:hypothetical protein